MVSSFKYLLSGAFCILLLLPPSQSAHAAVPDFVTFSGRLSDGTGWGMSMSLSLDLTLYSCECDAGQTCDDPCDPSVGALWRQQFTNVAVSDGYFSVTLGEGEEPNTHAPLAVADVFAVHDVLWIGLAIDGDVELTPRKQIGSVPYAMRAQHAETASQSEIVSNPHCATSPCVSADIQRVMSGPVAVPAGGAEVIVVSCPLSHPIPLSGGCYIHSTSIETLEFFPLNWESPQNWASPTASSRAGWSCHFFNNHSSPLDAEAMIICRR